MSKKGARRGNKSSSSKKSSQDSPRGRRGRTPDQASSGASQSKRGGGPQHGRGRSFSAPVATEESLAFDPRHREEAIERTRAFLAEKHAEAARLASERAQLESQPDAAKSSKRDEELKLDPWQMEAVQALLQGQDVIVDAPTTAGKTRVVESFFRSNMGQPHFRAAYTTPVKSLSNDKVRELRAMFGEENVGIATGDVKENLGAPIVVATLECYRNSLLGTEPDLGRNLVVFDEYHFLQDESRGSAWEESIILTPPSCQLLMLSASVENSHEFVGWMQKIRPSRRVELITVRERPVPLIDLIYTDGTWVLKDEIPAGLIRKDLKKAGGGQKELPLRFEMLVQRLRALEELSLTPCIIYSGRRASCEYLAGMILKSLDPLPEEESEKIGKVLEELHAEKKVLSFLTPNLRRSLQSYGVGFHHSGLAVPARYAIEALVKRGLLRYCVATMGLSVGINFAVRSACISDYERPGENGFTLYPPSEVLQMLGRAGRRGRDLVGYSLWPTITAYAKLGGAVREACDSRLRNDPTTFMGLTGRGFSLKDLEHFYDKSFRRYQQHHVDFALATPQRLMAKLKVEQLPCRSPAHEVAKFLKEDKSSLCTACPLQAQCHPYLEQKLGGSLAALHVHLHSLGALDESERLTSLGEIAKYIPQSGGILIAKYLESGIINGDNLLHAAELMAALSLARFKEPGTEGGYRFPFDPKKIEQELLDFYPEVLFPELYDPPYGRRTESQLREFNPLAGSVLRAWIQGTSWADLVRMAASENYGPGDIMALMYRVATYLQSISQAGLGEVSRHASHLREQVLREPLSYGV